MNQSPVAFTTPHCISSNDMDDGLTKLDHKKNMMKLIIDNETGSFSLQTTTAKSTASSVTKPKLHNKRVRFAPLSRSSVEYLAPRSPRLIQHLFYGEEEQADIIHEMQCDLQKYESGCTESEDFSVRGLERRTVEGLHERTKWRQEVRDAVLDEQDRQWAVLPPTEPVNDKVLAFCSLELTKKARDLALERALQDERDIYGDSKRIVYSKLSQEDDATVALDASWNTVTTNHSLGSSSRSSQLSSLSSMDELEEECRTPNSKGQNVHFPSSNVQQVRGYFEEEEAQQDDLWYPYLSLDEAKLQYGKEIALLEHQESRPEDAAHDWKNTVDLCWRGLEGHTAVSERQRERLRKELHKVVIGCIDGGEEEEELARQCQKLSAKSRKLARTRGLMDQRVIKAYVYHDQQKQDSKKQRITRKLNKKVVSSPKKNNTKGKPVAGDVPDLVSPSASATGSLGTVKRSSSTEPCSWPSSGAVNMLSESEKLHRCSDACSMGTCTTVASSCQPWWEEDGEFQAAPKSRRSSMPNLHVPPMMEVGLHQTQRRYSTTDVATKAASTTKLSAALYLLDRVLEVDEDKVDQSDHTVLPTSVLCIPNQYFEE